MRTLVLCATTVLLVTSGLTAQIAAAATATTVTGAPSTTRPVTGFAVPVQGTVTPQARGRAVELQLKQGGRWTTVTRANTRAGGRYVFGIAAPDQKRTFRIHVPATTTGSAAATRAFTVVGVAATRSVKRVTHRTCHSVGKNTWRVTFHLTLRTGERSLKKFDMTASGDMPYIGTIYGTDGATLNVHHSFADIC